MVAGLKPDFGPLAQQLRLAMITMRPMRGCFRWRVKRHIEARPTIGADHMHHLRQAGAGRYTHIQDLPVTEIYNRGRGFFDIEIRLHLGRGPDKAGAALKQQLPCHKTITPDIPDRATAPFGLVANIAFRLGSV